MTTPVKIPQQSVYKAAEVCAIAQLQPYVLRSWEAEFPDLGVTEARGRLRVYRRVDLDKVLRIKELLFVDGLTLGAARRKLLKETPEADPGETPLFEELIGANARARLEDVKQGLRAILGMLAESSNGEGAPSGESEADASLVVAPAGPKPVERKPSRAGRGVATGGKRRRKKA